MVHNSPSYASTPNVFGSSHRLQRASTPHNVPRPAKRSWVRFPCPPIDFPEKINIRNFLRRPSPRETSDAIHLFAFLRCRHVGAEGARCSLRSGPTPPPHPVLSTPWTAPHQPSRMDLPLLRRRSNSRIRRSTPG